MNQEAEIIINKELDNILNTSKVLSITYLENIIYSNIEVVEKIGSNQIKSLLKKYKEIIFINSQEEEIISTDYFFDFVEKNKNKDLKSLFYVEYFSSGEIDYEWILYTYLKKENNQIENNIDIFEKSKEVDGEVKEEEKIAIFLCMKAENIFLEKIENNSNLKNWCIENNFITNHIISKEGLEKAKLIEEKLREAIDLNNLLPLVFGDLSLTDIANKLEEELSETKISFYNELLNIVYSKVSLSENIVEEKKEEYISKKNKDIELISIKTCSDLLLQKIAIEIYNTKEIFDFNDLETSKIYGKYINQKEEILEKIKSENIFYQISTKRYYLKELLIIEVFKNLKENEEVFFGIIEDRARNILKLKTYNKRNFLSLFDDLNIEFMYNRVRIPSKDELEENLKSYFNVEKICPVDFFLKEESEISLQGLSRNVEDIDSFVLKVISHPKVGYIDDVLLKKEKLDIQDYLKKIHIYLDYINTKEWNLNYKTSIESILKTNPKGRNFKDIIEILKYQNKEIIDEEKVKEALRSKEFFKNGKTKFNLVNAKGKKIIYSGKFKDELDNLYIELGENEKIICEERIFSSQSSTLEEIGNKLNVSRERIRQQEKKLFGKLKFYKYHFDLYLKELNIYFNKHIVFSIKEFFRTEDINKIFNEVELSKILNVNNFYAERKLNILYEKYISIYTNEQILEYLFKKFKEDTIYKFEELENFLKGLKINNTLFLEDFISENQSIVRYKSRFLLKKSRWIISDRARLILDHLGEQAHFNKLCDLYNEEYDEKIESHPFHARISDCEYIIRTFTGTFALKEWEDAQEHIFTKDLATEYLREQRKPLHFNEVIEGVKDKTQANETTIRIFINNEQTFQYGYGIWALKEWKNDIDLSRKYYISQNRIDAGEEEHIHRQYLGKLIKNDRYISLHNATERVFFNNSGIYVKEEFLYKLNLSKFRLIDYYGNEFPVKIRIETEKYKLYGLKVPLENLKVNVGQPFYLEYYPQGYIRILTWEQFEFDYKEADLEGKEDILIDCNEEEEVMKIDDRYEDEQEDIEEVEETMTFEKLREIGIDQGFVYISDIEKIDFFKETKVKNIHEVYEELCKSEIGVL